MFTLVQYVSALHGLEAAQRRPSRRSDFGLDLPVLPATVRTWHSGAASSVPQNVGELLGTAVSRVRTTCATHELRRWHGTPTRNAALLLPVRSTSRAALARPPGTGSAPGAGRALAGCQVGIQRLREVSVCGVNGGMPCS